MRAGTTPLTLRRVMPERAPTTRASVAGLRDSILSYTSQQAACRHSPLDGAADEVAAYVRISPAHTTGLLSARSCYGNIHRVCDAAGGQLTPMRHTTAARAATLTVLCAALALLLGAIGVGSSRSPVEAVLAYPQPTDTPVPTPPYPAYPVFLPSMLSP